MTYVNNRSYIDYMSYVNNMSYVYKLSHISYISHMSIFMNRLKLLEIARNHLFFVFFKNVDFFC